MFHHLDECFGKYNVFRVTHDSEKTLVYLKKFQKLRDFLNLKKQF